MPFQTGRSVRGSRFAAPLLVLALAFPLAACESVSSLNPFAKETPYKPEIVPTVAAELLYNQGLALIEGRDFDGAAQKFADLDRQYPFSSWSKRALIMQTFANYTARNYDETIASEKRYLGLYPASDDAAYSAYMVANAYYNQIPDITRDQERSEKALLAMREVVERWPKSEYASDARAKLQVIRDQLAGREMEVGRYYLQRRNYTAAINRFRTVVSQYQTTNQIEEALARLTEAYMALGIVNEAQTAAAVLGHNFPEGSWYRDSYKLLQSRGLEPRESGGSWISKAMKTFRLG